MPGDSRKKEVSASQAELHSAEKQNLLLTPKIQVVPEPQQKVGENEGLGFVSGSEKPDSSRPRLRFFVN